MKRFSIIFSVFMAMTINAQSIVDSLTSDDVQESQDSSLATEKIESISPTRKILVITNSNGSYTKGDFISLIFKSQLIARAIVAKIKDNVSGIKIVKVYSQEQWLSLTTKQEIQILRGDDSYYLASLKKESTEDDASSLIDDDDDLFNETTFADGNLEIEDNKKRLIKPDNLLGGNIGAISVSTDTSSATTHFGLLWARQLSDNFWVEGMVGLSQISDYPGENIDTDLYSFTGRIKYTFSAPFYSFIQPYVGMQYNYASAPGAGVDVSAAAAEVELSKLEKLKRFKVAMGISVLKRLVPGWFIRADIGTDGMYAGLTLEF